MSLDFTHRLPGLIIEQRLRLVNYLTKVSSPQLLQMQRLYLLHL